MRVYLDEKDALKLIPAKRKKFNPFVFNSLLIILSISKTSLFTKEVSLRYEYKSPFFLMASLRFEMSIFSFE